MKSVRCTSGRRASEAAVWQKAAGGGGSGGGGGSSFLRAGSCTRLNEHGSSSLAQKRLQLGFQQAQQLLRGWSGAGRRAWGSEACSSHADDDRCTPRSRKHSDGA